MDESCFNFINKAIKHYSVLAKVLFDLYESRQANIQFDLYGQPYTYDLYDQVDTYDYLQLIWKLDCFKKDNPDNYEKYLNIFFIEFDEIWESFNDLITRVCEPLFSTGIMNTFDIHIGNKANTGLNIISATKRHIIELIIPETETQEQPQKFDKLKPIEKLLIINYLKIESLKRCQFGQKSGVFFLSRLLDINPESIKNPLNKLDDYTANELTYPQAANIYPILEKVKLFFDNSELKGISKEIEIRINALKRQLGKD